MAKIAAQDIQPNRTYSNGVIVFKARKVRPQSDHTMQVVTTRGLVLNFGIDIEVFDSANDIK